MRFVDYTVKAELNTNVSPLKTLKKHALTDKQPFYPRYIDIYSSISKDYIYELTWSEIFNKRVLLEMTSKEEYEFLTQKTIFDIAYEYYDGNLDYAYYIAVTNKVFTTIDIYNKYTKIKLPDPAIVEDIVTKSILPPTNIASKLEGDIDEIVERMPNVIEGRVTNKFIDYLIGYKLIVKPKMTDKEANDAIIKSGIKAKQTTFVHLYDFLKKSISYDKIQTFSKSIRRLERQV